MKYSLRSLMIVVVVAALGGCKGKVGEDGIRYYPPGPEFKRSEGKELPKEKAPAPNPPKKQSATNPDP